MENKNKKEIEEIWSNINESLKNKDFRKKRDKDSDLFNKKLNKGNNLLNQKICNNKIDDWEKELKIAEDNNKKEKKTKRSTIEELGTIPAILGDTVEKPEKETRLPSIPTITQSREEEKIERYKQLMNKKKLKYDLTSPREESKKETENVIKQQTQTSSKGEQSLYYYAQLLKEKVCMISCGDSLYCYNGKCYDIVNNMDIIRIFREKIDNTLSRQKSMNHMMQLYQFLRTDADISVERVDKKQRIAVLKNGIYDVMKKKLYSHTPKNIVFSYINANYTNNLNCTNFDKFLSDVTGNDYNLKERFWMFLGYTFMQTTEAKVFFLMGEAPDSGKSLLGNFIESLYPEKYVSNVELTGFNKEFSLASIVGSAVNISLDLPASKLNNTAISRLKMLTGGDTININQKYIPEFRYENRAKFIFATNFPIIVPQDNDAFWRRMIYLPFDKTVPKKDQDRTLLEKFQKEKDSIVSKALSYAKKLIKNDFKFPSTSSIDRKMQEWQGQSCATIESFLKECCICNSEYKGELMDDLYSKYEWYCESVGYIPKTRCLFKQFLESKAGLKHFKMRGRDSLSPQSAFRGIKIIYNGEYL